MNSILIGYVLGAYCLALMSEFKIVILLLWQEQHELTFFFNYGGSKYVDFYTDNKKEGTAFLQILLL